MIWEQLGIQEGDLTTWDSLKEFGNYPSGAKIQKGKVIFPRIDLEKEEGVTKEQPKAKEAEKKQEAGKKDAPGEITIEDFAKIDLRTAKVLQAERVKGADKLLKLQLEMGNKTGGVVSPNGIHPRSWWGKPLLSLPT